MQVPVAVRLINRRRIQQVSGLRLNTEIDQVILNQCDRSNETESM